jgi:hypothetical protein
MEHLSKLAGRPITATDLDQWRTEQRQDSTAFRTYLSKLYADLHQQQK